MAPSGRRWGRFSDAVLTDGQFIVVFPWRIGINDAVLSGGWRRCVLFNFFFLNGPDSLVERHRARQGRN